MANFSPIPEIQFAQTHWHLPGQTEGSVGGRGGERESQCRTGKVGRHVTVACYSHNEAERKKKETQRDGGRLWKAPSAEENSPSVIERRRDGGGWSVGQRLCLQQVHTNSSSNAKTDRGNLKRLRKEGGQWPEEKSRAERRREEVIKAERKRSGQTGMISARSVI